MDIKEHFEKSLEKYGNINNHVWYRPYYDSIPTLGIRTGKTNYQSLLKTQICNRVKLVRNSFEHKHILNNGKIKWEKVSQDTFFPNYADRISAIEKGKIPQKYKSVINGTIINNIINMVNNEKEYRRKENANPYLPHTIDGVWLVFGNDYDMYEFIKSVFYNLYEDLFIMYTCENNSIELSTDMEIIQRLLYFNAPFALIHGFLTIMQKEGQNFIINSDYQKKLRKLLVDTIEYAWNLIANDVLVQFKNTFREIKELGDNNLKYHSGNINSDIEKWNGEILIPLINKKINDIIKNDRTANIGLLVDDLMKELLRKREDDKNYVDNFYPNEISKYIIKESDEIFIDYIMRLTDLQYNDTVKREELRYAQSSPTPEEIERANNFELEGTYYDVGTNETISFC